MKLLLDTHAILWMIIPFRPLRKLLTLHTPAVADPQPRIYLAPSLRRGPDRSRAFNVSFFLWLVHFYALILIEPVREIILDLFEQGHERPLGGRIGRGRQVAEDVIHVKATAAAGVVPFCTLIQPSIWLSSGLTKNVRSASPNSSAY